MYFSWILERREMPDLSRIGEQEKLKPKAGDEPHWQRLRQGGYLGYRPSKTKAGARGLPVFMMPRHGQKRFKAAASAPATL